MAVHRQPLDTVSAVGVLAAALEEGVTLIDTARVYVDPDLRVQSERLVAAALRELDAADSVLVATKGGNYRDRRGFPVDGRPETIRRHCELSLRALAVERIGLYQLHKPDPLVPIS